MPTTDPRAAAPLDEASQRTLVAALAATLEREHGAVRHVETHISHVLVAGGHAYKLKKALRLPFADYATLAQRRFCCDEELRLNRRLAPALYLDVVPIGGPPDAPRLRATDDVVDWAVRMRAFAPDALLSSLLARGALEPAQVDALADVVAAFHARIPVAGADSPYGQPAQALADALANVDAVAPHAPPAQASTVTALRAWTQAEFDRVAPVMAQRRRDGFVRECHGDLHLGNVALVDGQVTVFDGIEFDPGLRWIDVMSEAGFAAMDLADRGRDDLAWRFVNRYLEGTGDYRGTALLRFHLVYRALVRAKVVLLRATQLGADAGAEALRDDAWRYLALAGRLARPAARALVVTHGVSGSGKTLLTQRLCEALPALRLRSDVERKRLATHAAPAAGALIPGRLYSAEATARTYTHLAAQAGAILDAGHAVIVDATFLARWQRDALHAVARARAVPFVILALDAPAAVLQARVAARLQRADDASEATPDVLARQLATREPLADDERASMLAADAGDADAMLAALQVRLR